MQKVEVYYCEYSMNILCKYEKKIKVHFLFAFLENTYFVCNSMGNGPGEGAITYFEALKGLLLKNAPYFFFF